MRHLIELFCGWPNGLVWSNVLAEPLIVAGTLAVCWPFRHKLMRRFVAFHHKHKEAHAASLEGQRGAQGR